MQVDDGQDEDDTAYELNLCLSCWNSIKKHKLPALALANNTALGSVPAELQDLIFIEESMIALCRAKCSIVQLSEQDSDLTFPQSQRGFHGNIIIYPQQPQRVATVLLPSIQEISNHVTYMYYLCWLDSSFSPMAL
jgi:hypothetical protein